MSLLILDEVVPKLSAEEAIVRVQQIDLSLVKMKLSDPEEARPWQSGELELAEREYMRFLALNLMYPDADIVPCRLVDEFWHGHILDTMSYAADTEAVFGTFLHHFPYFGMRGDEDAFALLNAYDRTVQLYEHHFGELPLGVWRPSEIMKCERKNCKPQKCR